MKPCIDCGETNEAKFYSYWKSRCQKCQRAKQRRFNLNNPNYVKAKNHNRRAWELALPNTLSTTGWTKIQERFENLCALTGSTDVSLEHMIPISWLHMGNEEGNVIPLDLSLNLSKGSKNFVEWFNEIDATLEMHKRFDEVILYLANLNGMTSEEYIDYIYWCEQNKRTVDQVAAATKSSIELFRESRIIANL